LVRRGGDLIALGNRRLLDFGAIAGRLLADDYIVSSFWQDNDMKPRLKMGMVGGGREATIGVIHEMAARLDGKIESWLAHFPRTPKDRS
jgi:hypothetical protein